MPIITLLSDFGTRDPYVAQMKGVIFSLCPGCQVVDITHEVEKHDTLMGAFFLETSVSHFPKGTVHVAIVDPGVGSRRLPIAIVCRRGVLVGPDNGLLCSAARKLGIISTYRIQRLGPGQHSVSATFHGRDVFAVTAAQLAAGLEPRRLGPKVSGLFELDASSVTLEKGRLKCHVLHVDRFGNIITNAENEYLGRLGLRHGSRVLVKCRTGVFQGRVVNSYYEAELRELVVLRGSQGYVEVALREQPAASSLEVKPRDELELRLR